MQKGCFITIENDADKIVIKQRDAEPPLERKTATTEACLQDKHPVYTLFHSLYKFCPYSGERLLS